ncbi:helix-turn-helix domain-containing protein [Streptomyces sp. NPDC057939]|uniref:AlbA family DNA-binding domain-containing protein n=1 Tax=Streptomyces sp. NPDC057939 TaxID=3346284 RepID=UPI0036E2CD81
MPLRADDYGKRDRTMTSIYLSSDNPRWVPKTEADLQAAINSGLFEENHHLDLEKAPSSKGDNRELARDLASFAVDGGTLIIGVQENKETQTFEPAPQPLNGLPEKIEPVARTIPDPPLPVITDVLKSEAGNGTGYVIVHIPASPVARTWSTTSTSAAATKPVEALEPHELQRLVLAAVDPYIPRRPRAADHPRGAAAPRAGLVSCPGGGFRQEAGLLLCEAAGAGRVPPAPARSPRRGQREPLPEAVCGVSSRLLGHRAM